MGFSFCDFEYYFFIRISSNIVFFFIVWLYNFNRIYVWRVKRMFIIEVCYLYMLLLFKYLVGYCCKIGFYLFLDNVLGFFFLVK